MTTPTSPRIGDDRIVGDRIVEPDGGERPEPSSVSQTPGAAVHASEDRRSTVPSVSPVAIVVAAGAALVAAMPLKDNSFFTHLATGRLMLAEGIPSENPFLFTGTSFPVPSWWWSAILAVAEDLGGGSGIRLLTAAVAGLTGLALVRLTRDTRDDASRTRLLSVVAPSVLALVCTFQFLSGRPHLLGFLLLALSMVVWLEERSPWWLLPIMAVWVNVHGSWVYGVVVLVAFGVARALDDRRVRPRDLWAVLAAAGGVVAGGALYPDRFAIVLLPTRQFGDSVEREALQTYKEWAPVGLDRPVLWALVALGALALYGCLRNRRYAMALVALGLFVMGVSGLRFVPVAAVSLVPFAALGLRDIGSLRLPSGRSARLTSAVGVAVLVAAVGYCFTGEDYDLRWYPVDAVDWLEDRELVARPDVRVVSHDYVGNYLEWRYGTDANAYTDDRPDAATVLDYVSLLYLRDGWPAALERADPDVVLWSTDEPLTAELAADDDWTVAVERGDFTVLCRAELAGRCR